LLLLLFLLSCFVAPTQFLIGATLSLVYACGLSEKCLRARFWCVLGLYSRR
jgi:hypothetical protein